MRNWGPAFPSFGPLLLCAGSGARLNSDSSQDSLCGETHGFNSGQNAKSCERSYNSPRVPSL